MSPCTGPVGQVNVAQPESAVGWRVSGSINRKQRAADINIDLCLSIRIKRGPKGIPALHRCDRSTKVGNTRRGGHRNPTISLTTA